MKASTFFFSPVSDLVYIIKKKKKTKNLKKKPQNTKPQPCISE